jgi:catechol 2,3-dioxygenase-like lactoylglutathione lyase family enzyme
MDIEFVTSVAMIAPDPPRSRALYIDTLGLPLADDGDSGYLHSAGHQLMHPPREEPWGQTVARLLSPEGAIVGISFAPMLH